MNRDQKRALFSLLIWSIVLVAFIPLFFIDGGADNWVPGSMRVIISSSFIITGFILFFTMLALTKKKPGVIERDERDILIGRKASEITLTIVTVYVFLTCIILYFLYKEINSVPIGWMWFLGCTCLFVGYITSSAISLVLYSSKVKSNE